MPRIVESIEPDPHGDSRDAVVVTVRFVEETPWWVPLLRKFGIVVEFTPDERVVRYTGSFYVWSDVDTGKRACDESWLTERVEHHRRQERIKRSTAP